MITDATGVPLEGKLSMILKQAKLFQSISRDVCTANNKLNTAAPK